jgi:hypothetical protein
MANNYTQFSFDFIVPESQRVWVREIEELIEKHQGEEVVDGPLLEALPYWNEYQEAGFILDIDLEEGCCWIHTDESGNTDSTVNFLQCLLARLADECKAEHGTVDPSKMELNEVGFTYSDTCSSPRVGEFGGGAIRIFVDGGTSMVESDYITTDGWLADAFGGKGN